MDSRTKKQLRDLAKEATKQQDALYVVGGTVRDRWLGRDFRDIDLICRDAKHWAQWFSKHIHSSCVALNDTPGQEVFRVPLNKTFYCDFCTRQGETPEEDLAHRDFTINALAQPLEDFLDEKKDLIDRFNGVQDLKGQIVRKLPGKPFEDDALRMLRAFRQAAVLGFTIEPGTMTAIKENTHRINLISSERISQELLLLFSTQQPNIPDLLGSGILSDLMNNAGIILRNAENLLDNWTYYQTCWDTSHFPLSTHQKYYLDLLNDNAKRAQFGISLLFAHLDSKEANKFMKLYKFSNRQTENVTATVQLCQAIHQYWEENGTPPPEALLYQGCTNFEEIFPQALLLAALSLQSKTLSHEKWRIFLGTSLSFFTHRYLPATAAKPLITGNDLQESFNLKPSPLFKTLLESLREARVLGSVTTREQAETFIRKLIAKESS